MPPLMERPHDRFHPLETGAARCHEGEFCFFADRNFEGFMIYGNNSGNYCGDQDLAWSGGSFHEQTSSCINNTNYRIRVYDGPSGVARQLLWTMSPRYSADYVGSFADVSIHG
jgi:hypothetical protein